MPKGLARAIALATIITAGFAVIPHLRPSQIEILVGGVLFAVGVTFIDAGYTFFSRARFYSSGGKLEWEPFGNARDSISDGILAVFIGLLFVRLSLFVVHAAIVM